MTDNFREDLIMSQILKNVYYREKVLQHITPDFFDEVENEKMFEAIKILISKDKVQKLDGATLKLRYNNVDRIKFLINDIEDYPTENIPFLLKQTEYWGGEQALKRAILDSADDIKEGKGKSLIGGRIKQALSFSFDKNVGLNYTKDIHKRFEFYNKIDEKISTGWDMLDVFTNGGLQKKTLTIGAGSSGLGKTLLGTNLTATLIKSGLTGVYITLELAEEFIARRIDSVIAKVPYYSLPREEGKVAEEIQKKVKGNVYVREYPPSKASCANIINFIKDLEISEKVKMDFVVVDYIQLMKPNYANKVTNSYEKYKDIAEELREMAVEMNIPVISFSQVQRAGYGNSGMGLSHIADSIGIVNTADLVIGMTQTLEEEEDLLQTWRIIKNRLGRKGVEFRIQLDDDLLVFNQVINDEERVKIRDFLDRQCKVLEPINNMPIDNPVEEARDFEKFADENIKAEEKLYKGFS
jgi:KaiC/GvpD/RAD55 family RecA-like ATPase